MTLQPLLPADPLHYQPQSVPPSQPPPAGIRALIAWGVILVAVAFFVGSTIYRYHKLAAMGPDASGGKEMQLTVGARVTVGMNWLLSMLGQGKQQIDPMIAQMDALAGTPAQKMRNAIVVGETSGGKAALDRLTQLEPLLGTENLQEDSRALRQIYSQGAPSLAPAQRERLIERYDWFGHLAMGYEQAADNPDRALAITSGQRAILVEVTAIVLGGIAVVAGLVLLIIAIVLLGNGKIRRAYQPTGEYSVHFLEAFAIYIGGFLLISLIVKGLDSWVSIPRWIYYVALLIPPAFAVAWPRVCGVPADLWRQGLGFHRGRGALREIGLGLAGYIAGLPIVGTAILIALLLTRVAGAEPTHPIVQELTGSRAALVGVFLLACVYAPLVEETMFRGAFFHYLRARHRWLLSASLTAFLFAAIHPQGWTMIPALFGIAIVLAAIREWRGTILASAAAHALNNGTVLLFAILLLR